jgi:transposase
LFVGWDWATTAHDVTVIDSAGDRVHRMAILHTEDGIARAVAKLAGYGDPGELPVAIETTRGLVVDRLLPPGTL